MDAQGKAPQPAAPADLQAEHERISAWLNQAILLMESQKLTPMEILAGTATLLASTTIYYFCPAVDPKSMDQSQIVKDKTRELACLLRDQALKFAQSLNPKK